MLQFIVSKENKKTVEQWTERILTVSTPVKMFHGAPDAPSSSSSSSPLAPHIVYLSRKDHPEVLCHHKLRVTEIRLWPHHGGSLLEGVAAVMTPTQKLALTLELKGKKQKVRQGEEELLLGTLPSGRTMHTGGAAAEGPDGVVFNEEMDEETQRAAKKEGGKEKKDSLFSRTETLKLYFSSLELLRRAVVCVRGEPGEVQLLGSFKEVEEALQSAK